MRDAALEHETEFRLFVEQQNKELQNMLVDMYKANPKVNVQLRERLPASKQHHCLQLEREKLTTSFESFCKELGELENSSKNMDQELENLPDQTSSEVQMEDWSKENQIQSISQKMDASPFLNQASQNVQASLQVTFQEPAMQTKPEAVNKTNLPTPYPKTLCALSDAKNVFTDHVEVHFPSEKSNNEERVSECIQQQRTDFWKLQNPSSNSLESGHHISPVKSLSSPSSLHVLINPVTQLKYDQFLHMGFENKYSSIKKEGNSPSNNLVTSGQVTAVFDKEKNIAFLLKELDAMREANKKLQEKISEKDKELETLKLNMELQETSIEAKIAEKAAAFVEEVYNAQRERDTAVMARLRLANEERDEALLRTKQMEQAIEELENINPEENDMTLQELLNRINNAGTGLAIEKNGAVIVDRIHKTKERKKKITAEEMNAVIEERDAALSRCKQLEQELHHLKEQNQTSANNIRHLTAENNQERALKGQVLNLQQERDSALQKCKKLEEEIQTLRVYYSLHKSLSQEASLKEQFDCTLNTYEDALRTKEDIVSITHHQNEELTAQLQLALADRASMEQKLHQSLEATQEANEKVQKLERLVDVLRKKVGAGTIRTVI
nr:PREDICTED: mirror-image polydactyly gene 1 protein isoform X3 [Latimeria chalumnae]|eukprot:XP_005989224.1 PREDICTED: mirror-image polydactyly gene 1 protein isoform X3 [Latimeria chalumnae]